MSYLDDQEDHIKRVTSQIKELEKLASADQVHKKDLAHKYKEQGDLCINLYRDTYAVRNLIQDDLADMSFESYERAAKLFDDIQDNLKSIYARLAFGNACKERCLPKMGVELLQKYQAMAIENFELCANYYFADVNQFAQEYLFVLLLQADLLVRRTALCNDLLPKNVIVFHSLKSPESHICLDGICYFSYKHNCEIWEYRFGKVRTFDEPTKYIKDRLNETSAVVFIASEDYDLRNDVVRFEIETTISIKKSGDPLAVFVVDLGNCEVVERLQSIATVVKFDQLDEIFKLHYDEIKDIYFCRRYRCERNIVY